ncbi:PAS domain S-box protein [uncultured Hydrogenophaga sp.]|uniref:PAS domain S-box protein n=1 Tax=uncultured Hydrogenophaga sp. TaxID=199683 RepID=UPI00265F45D2|nr:PAS domain S-box protein [uncultured Hydrogenophaga sp.]
MNALPSVQGTSPAAADGDPATSARERALLLQIETLQAENEHLRQVYARQLAGEQASRSGDGHVQLDLDLPLSLDSALLPGQTGSVPTAQLEYRELFAALASVFPMGVFRTDHTGVLTHVDGQLEQIFGLSKPDFPNFGWLDRVHPDDLERVRQSWIQAISRGEGISVEFRIVRPDAETTHVMVRNAPLRDAQGNVTSQLGFVQDITALRTLEAEARIKDELNRQIIATSPDCTMVLDLEGRVIQMTAQGCRLMEIERFDAAVMPPWTAWWLRDGAPLAADALNQAREGRSARFVAECPTFQGTPKWWDTMISPIRSSEGRAMMLLVVSRDISELQRQQAAILEFNTELENRVRQRTDELAEAKDRITQALREAQVLYNEAPCGYHSVDADGTFVLMNRTELEWLGYRRDEVIGQLHFRDIILPEQIPLARQRLSRIIAGEKLEPAEFTILRRNGQRFHGLLNTTAVYDEKGRFVRTNNTLVDISERKAAEEALREHQHFLRNITDHVPVLIAYVDRSGRYRFANAGHRQMYGIEADQLIGRHMSEVFPAQVWQDIEPLLAAALNGEARQLEAWRRDAAGRAVFVQVHYRPDTVDGFTRGVFLQMVDITERKRIEERIHDMNEELEARIRVRSAELMASEQRFRLMVDNLRDYSIFFMDTAGRITDWTDSAQRMNGYSPVQMMGRHYGLLLDPNDPDAGIEEARRMLRLAASRGQHDMQAWQERRDGSRYWSHSVLIALRDNQGELLGYANVNRDMTDGKRLDDMMRNINDELEQRVVERTEQLVAANRDLESFSYSVSHDLRAPLRHISSFVSLLHEHMADRIDDVGVRYLNTIGNSARHMSQLIDGLLAFSRLGRAAMNPVPVDMNGLVVTVVSQIAHDTEGRVVDWMIAPDLPVVQGDALLLREVWTNLLGNAFKYTRPRDRALIEVSWQIDPLLGYTFSVRDNGVGFDSKYSQKLFGVFQRLHRATEFEGTGIGLALARRIVERHGGTIWAESRLGEGSVFHFSLPIEGLHPNEANLLSMPVPLEP